MTSLDDALSYIHDIEPGRKAATIKMHEKGIYYPIQEIFRESQSIFRDIYVSWAIISDNEDYIEITLYDLRNFEFRHMRINSEFIEKMTSQ